MTIGWKSEQVDNWMKIWTGGQFDENLNRWTIWWKPEQVDNLMKPEQVDIEVETIN